MLFSQFQAAVNACLGPEATRRGLEAFRAQHQTNALIDLQRYIKSFRVGNSTVYNAANLTVQGKAMVGALPLGAKVKAFYIYSTGPNDDPNCKRYKLDYYPWNRRQEILCGALDFVTWWSCCCWPGAASPPCPAVPPTPDPNNPNPYSWCESRAYVYSISPNLDSFVIYPPLNQYDSLLMVWDGYKSVFNPGDIVPYPIEASEPVAAYILSKVHGLIDREPALAQSDMQAYSLGRRALVREWRDNQVTDGQDDEYLSTIVPPPGQSFITAGAEPIVLLQNITAILGTAGNCLQAVPTYINGAALVGPLTVVVNVGGPPQFWTLKAGTDATDVPNGILQPADYALSGLVWYETNP